MVGSRGVEMGGDGQDQVPITCSFQALRPSEFRSGVKVEVAVLGSLVPKGPYGLCACKATLKTSAQERCESRGGRPGLPCP